MDQQLDALHRRTYLLRTRRHKVFWLLGLLLSLCLTPCRTVSLSPPPTEIPLDSRVSALQASRSTLPVKETADLRLDVVKVVNDETQFQFVWSATGGQIVAGQNTCCASYQAPELPGNYQIQVTVAYGNQIVQRAVTLAVIQPTLAVTPSPTPTPALPTSTPSPLDATLPDAKAYYERAGQNYLRRDYERTIADYTQAIELKFDPLSDPYYLRGFVYYVQREYGKAIEDFNKAIELNYDPVNQVYYDRANAYYYQGRYDQAINDYGKAIELKFEPASQPYNNRGLAYRKKGALDQAIADYTKAIELKHEPLTWPYVNRGNVYAEQGQHDQAIADYTQALQLDATSVNAYYSRGLAYKNKGDAAHAIADFQKVIELDQDYWRKEAEQQLQELGVAP
ncbi:MAG: tetratricopeptide repeat protein [Anaerolineae bacterium]